MPQTREEPFSFVSHGVHLSLSVEEKDTLRSVNKVSERLFSVFANEWRKKQVKRGTVPRVCFDQWLWLVEPEGSSKKC